MEELRSLDLIKQSDSRSTQDLADSFMIPAGIITRINSAEELNKDGLLETKDVRFCEILR